MSKSVPATTTQCDFAPPPESTSRKRGRKTKPVHEFPEPLATEWSEPASFPDALLLHATRHGDSICHLHKALACQGAKVERSTLLQWAAGKKCPRSVGSLAILALIEKRYRLPGGYFKNKLPVSSRAVIGHDKLKGITASQRRRIAWHLPDDFEHRPSREREEILDWIRRVIISGSTDYRRFQAEAARHRYAVRFPEITGQKTQRRGGSTADEGRFLSDVELDLAAATMGAPRLLADEMADLIRFKTATLTDIGFQRSGVWNDSTALQKVEHLGLLFGALAARPDGHVQGLGMPRPALAMGLLVFPSVWDWYVQWRERRRGFYTVWEVNMLQLGMALTRSGTGWLRQSPGLAERLQAVPELVNQSDVDTALGDWDSACDILYRHLKARSKEIQRVARIHRDPFEPIMPVLGPSQHVVRLL